MWNPNHWTTREFLEWPFRESLESGIVTQSISVYFYVVVKGWAKNIRSLKDLQVIIVQGGEPWASRASLRQQNYNMCMLSRNGGHKVERPWTETHFPYLTILSRISSFHFNVLCARHGIGCQLLVFTLSQIKLFTRCDKIRQVFQTSCALSWEVFHCDRNVFISIKCAKMSILFHKLEIHWTYLLLSRQKHLACRYVFYDI